MAQLTYREAVAAGIAQEMGSNFDLDPKMAPRGVMGPQNGPQRPNMTPNCTEMT